MTAREKGGKVGLKFLDPVFPSVACYSRSIGLMYGVGGFPHSLTARHAPPCTYSSGEHRIWVCLVSTDLALCWTGFGNLISKLPSPNYYKNSGWDGEGVILLDVAMPFCFLAQCLLLVLCSLTSCTWSCWAGVRKTLLVTSSLGEQGQEMF